ncbi:immunity protein TriTu family protein [Brevibacillus porteri]|uniref:immunity protein TriTu family protein n=1 Tax=Brevibacillus porteri TaxID=2126350 RepID=UPI003D245810
MILSFFRDWAERKSAELQNSNISSEIISSEFIDSKIVHDPSSRVIHESQLCIGQIIVWKSQQFEMEVLHIESEELIYWKYLEKIDSNLDEITSDYFQVLQTGLKL